MKSTIVSFEYVGADGVIVTVSGVVANDAEQEQVISLKDVNLVLNGQTIGTRDIFVLPWNLVCSDIRILTPGSTTSPRFKI